MSDFIFSNKNARLNIFQPVIANNIYILADTIYINSVLDASYSILGGLGGKGGDSAPLGQPSNPSLVQGDSGNQGTGPNPGAGGSGGFGFSNALGLSGETGFNGLSPNEVAASILTNNKEDYFNFIQNFLESGSGGGAGGGGSAGDSSVNINNISLVAGAGAGGTAGGAGGGKIILVANNIQFGPNAQIISKGSISGSPAFPPEYVWDEEEDEDGNIITRNIQSISNDGTKPAVGSLGGDNTIQGNRISTPGGVSGLREISPSISNPLGYPYTLEQAEKKQGGPGGFGGAGSGGHILNNSSSVLQNTDVTGGDNNSGRADNKPITFSGSLSANKFKIYKGIDSFFVAPSGNLGLWSSNSVGIWNVNGNTITSNNLDSININTTFDDFVSISVLLSSVDNNIAYLTGTFALEDIPVPLISATDSFRDVNKIDALLCDTFAFSGEYFYNNNLFEIQQTNNSSEYNIIHPYTQNPGFRFTPGYSNLLNIDTQSILISSYYSTFDELCSGSLIYKFDSNSNNLICISGVNLLEFEIQTIYSETLSTPATSSAPNNLIKYVFNYSPINFPNLELNQVLFNIPFTGFVQNITNTTLPVVESFEIVGKKIDEFNIFAEISGVCFEIDNNNLNITHISPLSSIYLQVEPPQPNYINSVINKSSPITLSIIDNNNDEYVFSTLSLSSGITSTTPYSSIRYPLSSTYFINTTAWLYLTEESSFFYNASSEIDFENSFLDSVVFLQIETDIGNNFQTISAEEYILNYAIDTDTTSIFPREYPPDSIKTSYVNNLSSLYYLNSNVSTMPKPEIEDFFEQTQIVDTNSPFIFQISATLTDPPITDIITFSASDLNIDPVLSTTPYESIRYPLTSTLSPDLTAWVYLHQENTFFYNASTVFDGVSGLPSNELVSVQLEYNSNTSTVVRNITSTYTTVFSTVTSAVQIPELIILSPDVNDTTTLINEPSSIFFETPEETTYFKQFSAFIDENNSEIVFFSDNRFDLIETLSANGTYDEFSTIELSGSYFFKNSGFDVFLHNPGGLLSNTINVQFSSITAEEHKYNSLNIFDSTNYTPLTIDSNTLTLNITNSAWYQPSFVNTWAPLTDTAALGNIITNQSGIYQNPAMNIGLFNGSTIEINSEVVLTGNGETISLSDSIEVLPDSNSIATIEVTPLSGYFGHTTLNLQYNQQTCDVQVPGLVAWQIRSRSLNTSNTVLLSSVVAPFSIDYNLNPSINEVIEIDVRADGIEVHKGTYYPIPQIITFNSSVSPITGYLSATPFEVTTTFNHSPVNTPGLIPSLISPISAKIEYPGLDVITDIIKPENSTQFFNQSVYAANHIETINQSVKFLDIPEDVSATNSSMIVAVEPPEVLTAGLFGSGICNNNYFGNIVTFSAEITSYGLPFVVELRVDGTEEELFATNLNSFTTEFDLTVLNLDSNIQPYVLLYPLLEPINPEIDNSYLQEYIKSGLEPIRYDLQTLTNTISSGAVQSNIGITTTITDNGDVETISGNEINISLNKQQSAALDKNITTSISFNSIVSGCLGLYSISANYKGTIISGSTSINISFSQSTIESFTVPFTASDGTNTFVGSIFYNFSAINFIIPTIYFDSPSPVSNNGCKSLYPLKVNVFDNVDRETHTISLYVRNSKSIPYSEINNRYRHLVPQWRFLDINGNVIESIQSNNVKIFNGSEFIGVSGSVEFYYVDDTPTEENGVLLVATMSSLPFVTDLDSANFIDQPGYANSKLNATQIYHVNQTMPNALKITRDGLRDYRPYYWTCSKIPYTITFSNTIFEDSSCIDLQCSPSLYYIPDVSGVEMPYDISLNIDNQIEKIDTRFVKYDKDNLPRYGFVRGTGSPLVSSASANFIATTQISVSSIRGKSPFAWISNPIDRTINRIAYNSQSTIDFYKDCIEEYSSGSIFKDDIKVIEIPYKTTKVDAMEVTGMAGVFGIAVTPFNDAWMVDGELDRLYKFSPIGDILEQIDLPYQSTPAGVALDGCANVFVTLSNSISSIKFDVDGNYLTTFIHPSADVNSVDEYNPSQVDIDHDNNVYIAYYNNDTSLVSKFDNNGIHLFDIVYEDFISIFDMVVDFNNNLWVVYQFNENNLDYPSRHFNGEIVKYGPGGAVLEQYSNLNNPHYITFDNNGDIWFTDAVNRINKIENGSISTINNATSGIVEAAGSLEGGGDHELTGVIGTLENNVYVLNGKLNLMFVFDISTNTLEAVATIYPNSSILFYNDLPGNIQYEVQDDRAQSATAYGDWTGFKWHRKFITPHNIGDVLELSGSSSYFKVEDSPEEVRIINDSYNLSERISKMFLPEHLNSSSLPTFHKQYLRSIIGTNESPYQSISRQFYEKIANFVMNNADIETCNIQQLLSICESLDVPVDNFNLNLPADLKHLMDIVSIHHGILRGVIDGYNLYFGPGGCELPSVYTAENMKEFTLNRELTSLSITDNVSAGDGLVVYDQRHSNYDLIFVFESTALSGLSGYGMRTPIVTGTGFNQYQIYKYISNNQRPDHINNIIDWNNELNTLSYTISSIDDWYGDYGLVEKLFDYEIHKGLGFLDCAKEKIKPEPTTTTPEPTTTTPEPTTTTPEPTTTTPEPIITQLFLQSPDETIWQVEIEPTGNLKSSINSSQTFLNYVILETNSQKWKVSISDSGNLLSEVYNGNNPEDIIILTDINSIQWLITITNTGNLLPTQV